MQWFYELKFDIESLGNKLLLVDVVPVYEYRDNVRTDNVVAHRYIVAVPEHELEKLAVKIDGKQLVEKPDMFVEVEFDGLEITAYENRGTPQIRAKANGISLVNNKK